MIHSLFMKSSLKLRLAWFAAATILLVSLPASGASVTTTASSDAFVATGPTGDLSGNNFGSAGALAISAGALPKGEFQSVVQFDLSAARNSFDRQFGAGLWTAESVTLRLTSSPHNNPIFNDIAAGQFSVSLMQNNSWVEGSGTGGTPTTDGISFNSLQSTYINNATDQDLGTFTFSGGSSGANTYQLGLSSSLVAKLLAGDDLSLRLYAADNSISYLFSSRANVAAGPQLTIIAVPEPANLSFWLGGFAMVMLWRWRRSQYLRNRSAQRTGSWGQSKL